MCSCEKTGNGFDRLIGLTKRPKEVNQYLAWYNCHNCNSTYIKKVFSEKKLRTWSVK